MNEEERSRIKEQIITKEAREMELLRDLRGVRGEIEGLRRKLEMKCEKVKLDSEGLSWTAKDEEEYCNDRKAYREKHGIPMER